MFMQIPEEAPAVLPQLVAILLLPPAAAGEP